MSFFSETILKYVQISPSQMKEIEAEFNITTLPRKSLLATAGAVTNKLALIESGYLRMYHIDTSGKETTVWIGGPGKFVTSISSFVNRKPSYWNIETMTESKLHLIKVDSHFRLCRTFRVWLDFENLLLTKALTALEHRTFELASLKAEARFRQFFERNADLFLHVPSKHIASLLGLSEETMSRLRKNN